MLWKKALICLLTFGTLDFIWFKVFMSDFSRTQIGHLMRPYASVWHALVSYFLMIVAGVVFIDIDPGGSVKAILKGALLGLCIFGIFDFTNGALLQGYTLKFALIDTLWGGFMYGVAGYLCFSMARVS